MALRLTQIRNFDMSSPERAKFSTRKFEKNVADMLEKAGNDADSMQGQITNINTQITNINTQIGEFSTASETIIKTAKDSNGDAVCDYTLRGARFIPHSVSTDLPKILETKYAGMGATNSASIFQVATIELVLSGNDGNGHFFEQTFRGIIYRLRTGGDAWAIDTNLLRITALDVGTATGLPGASIVLSGANNGDITIGVSYSYISDPSSDWNYRVRIYSGGRFA